MKSALLTDEYCRRLVLRRLCALDYAVDDLSGNGFAGGGSPSILNLDANFIPLAPGETTGGAYPMPAPVSSSGSGASSWLSGLTGLGTAVTNIVRAVDPPKSGTVLYNPQTGLPYGINPATGQPYAAAQTQSLVTLAFWVLLAFLAFRLLSKTG